MSGSSVRSAIDVVFTGRRAARPASPPSSLASRLRRVQIAPSGEEEAMDDPQAVLDAVVARGDAPFAVGLAARGRETVAAAAGEAAPGLAAGPDTVLRIFSMTKAVAATAAAMLAERGRLDLDAPVTDLLPEFGRVRVLDGWDGEAPRLRAPVRPPTARELAAHVSGFAYTHWNAEMKRYRAASGLPAMASGVREALFYPLAADPGAAWAYGIGIDWLGLVCEAAAGVPIDVFCRDEIFGPLGMADTGFAVTPAMEARLARAWRREGAGFAPLAIAPPAAPEFWGMGDALYGTAADYLRFLRLFLGGGAVGGARLLRPESVAAMLADQIGGLRAGRMVSTTARVSADVEFFPGLPVGHSLIGQRLGADAPGRRRAGSSFWAGILNTHWWLDPASGVAGIVATQVLPFMDPGAARMLEAFERAVYAAGPAA